MHTGQLEALNNRFKVIKQMAGQRFFFMKIKNDFQAIREEPFFAFQRGKRNNRGTMQSLISDSF